MSQPIYKVIMDDGNGEFVNIYGKWVGNTSTGHAEFDETSTLFNPKLSVEVNEPGSFEFVMPPNHSYYSRPTLYKTTVEVFEFNGSVYESIFYGRVISISVDFYKQKTVRCEGCLAFFKDHVIDKIESPGTKNIYSPKGFFGDVVSDYNSNSYISDGRKFNGTIESVPNNDGPVLTKTIYRYVEFENCWDVIDQKILKAEGGYLLTRRNTSAHFSTLPRGFSVTTLLWICADIDADNPYPPYKYQRYNETTQQNEWVTPTADAAYANNLMTLSFEQELEDLYTAVAPIYKYEDDNTGKTKFVTIKGVDASNTSGDSYKLDLEYSNEFTDTATLDILGNTGTCAKMRRVCPATVGVRVPTITGTWTIEFVARYTSGTYTYTYPDGYPNNWNLNNWQDELLSAELILTHDSSDTTANPKVEVTCEYSNIGNSGIYIWNYEAKKRYGFMQEIYEVSSSGVESLSDVKSTTKRKKLLLKEAVSHLEQMDFRASGYEIKAAELAYLKPTLTKFSLGTNVHVVSSEHGIDTNLTVTKLEYALDTALKNVTVGTPQMVSLTEFYRKKSKDYTKDYSVGGRVGD